MNQVFVENQWNYLTYIHGVGGNKLDEKKGGVCDVQWPDGTVTTDVVFVSEAETVDTYDHGHTYKTQRYLLQLQLDYRGCRVVIPIETTGVLIGRVRQ